MKQEITSSSVNNEKPYNAANGWAVLVTACISVLGGIFLVIASAVAGVPLFFIFAVLVFLASAFMFAGLFTLQPNTGAVLILFWCVGQVREAGFFNTNSSLGQAFL